MRATMLAQLACWMDGHLVRDTGPIQIEGVFTDTRTRSPDISPLHGQGALFIALKGANFDGHDHVADAAKLGASAALVSREIDCNLPQIVTENTEHALAKLATKLQSLRKTQTIALTGSNGKTTVKHLTASILQQVGKTYFNPGNRNNEIGLPLAVIDAPEDADFAVYEMGAGQPGDIAWLAAISPPHIALVNNVAPAHLERMHSLLGVAETKAAIYDALPETGVAIINADDAFAEFFAARIPGQKIVRFGLEASADIRANNIQHQPRGTRFVLVTPQGEIEVWLPLPGRHNVSNALAAAALALAAGAELTAVSVGLENAQAVPGRMCPHDLANGAVLIDDSYNANPGSLAAAIELLSQLATSSHVNAGQGHIKTPTWLVLGDMRELGAQANTLHAAVGEQARKAGITKLFTLGPLSTASADAFGDQALRFDTHDMLITALQNELAQTRCPPVMLVKGSRGSTMERVVNTLIAPGGNCHAT